MRQFYNSVVILVIMIFMTVAHAESGSISLKKNPFKRPVFVSDKNKTSFATTSSLGDELDLRAAMFAGKNSLVNIGGNIVRIGEEINGYRLMSVLEDKVIFSKNNSLFTISLKKN